MSFNKFISGEYNKEKKIKSTAKERDKPNFTIKPKDSPRDKPAQPVAETTSKPEIPREVVKGTDSTLTWDDKLKETEFKNVSDVKKKFLQTPEEQIKDIEAKYKAELKELQFNFDKMQEAKNQEIAELKKRIASLEEELEKAKSEIASLSVKSE